MPAKPDNELSPENAKPRQDGAGGDAAPDMKGDPARETPSADTSGAPSRDPRIMPLAKSNVLLYLTIFYVVAKILLPEWWTFGLLGLLIVFLGAALACRHLPRHFPGWFRTVSHNFMARLRDNPLEICLVFGIVLLSLPPRLLVGDAGAFSSRLPELFKQGHVTRQLRELFTILLLIMAFILNRRKYSHKFRRRSSSRLKESATEAGDSAAAASQAGNSDSADQQWEAKQQQRWEQWLDEEGERLNESRTDRQKRN